MVVVHEQKEGWKRLISNSTDVRGHIADICILFTGCRTISPAV